MASTTDKSRGATRSFVLVAVVGVAFFGAFQFAQARSSTPATPASSVVPSVTGPAGAGPGDSGTPACCSSVPVVDGISGERVEGTAEVAGDIQAIDVDLSTGIYSPNVIVLKAGVPAEITFGQSSGCTGQIMSKDLGFYEDLTTGAKTVKLPALDAGEYPFACGMEMVFGKIVVE